MSSDVSCIKSKVVFETLPTGKPHVSFSEVSSWIECSFRHKLQQIDKVSPPQEPSPYPEFGSAVHAAAENYINTKIMDTPIATSLIREVWERDALSDVEAWCKQAEDILADIPSFMDSNFPDWEAIDAEHQLYEPIGDLPHAFKGFIDAIIVVPSKKKNGKPKYWVLDWKTTSWGWDRQKKQNQTVQSQIVLYKNFWSKKLEKNPSDISCGFVLLKRAAKPGLHCELIKVSAGPKTTERSLKVVNNMIRSVKKGVAIKNRYSCQWCEFKDTPHCP